MPPSVASRQLLNNLAQAITELRRSPSDSLFSVVCCTINTHPKSAKAVKPLIFNYFLEMGFRWLKLFVRHLATGFLSRAWDFDRIAEGRSLPPA
jgi:hypothetical protein